MLTQTLIDIGLTDYEARLYLALLELGESSVSQITKKIGTHIGRIYEILDTLVQKGFASCIEKNGVKYFTAAAPSRIKTYLEQKQQEIITQTEAVKKILPQFEQLLNSTKKMPHVEIYTGFEGLKTAYLKEAEHYSANKELFVMGVKDYSSYDKQTLDFFTFTINPIRKRSKVRIKKIDDVQLRAQMPKDGAEHRFLPLHSAVSINVIDNLTLISWSLPQVQMVITIEDLATAQGFIQQFDYLWNIASK